MSGGILEDVSILDLPAFAHSIGTLEKSQKRESGWPTELNFAIRNGKKDANTTELFTKYKKLLEDWRNYMLQLDSTDYEDYWTENMANNEYFNFTHYIKKDIKTFLTAVTGMLVDSDQSDLCKSLYIIDTLHICVEHIVKDIRTVKPDFYAVPPQNIFEISPVFQQS